METTACPLCGETESRVRYTVPDALLGLPGTFTLVECNSCGLLYQNPRLTLDEIEPYYPPAYDSFTAIPWANPNRLSQLAHLYGLKKRWQVVERYAPQRDGKRRMLDIGCATGVFLAAGSDSWQKTGVELSAAAAQIARSKFGLTVYQGTLEQVALDGQPYDAITMWDVLEHLPKPTMSLEHIRQLLRPDGILVVRVPSRSSWDSRLFGRYWAGLDQPRHMFIPNEMQLSHLLEQSGFRVVALLCLGGTYGMLVLNWRFWVHQHIRDPLWAGLARRVVDNLLVQIALLPLLWVVDRKLRKGSVVTVVAQPI